MKHFRPERIAWLALVLAVICAGACTGSVGPEPRAGSLFRSRWWNHYTRALEAADALDFAAARRDLTAALRQRDRDQRMARTYGMHFIDYFPHRELGVVYWLEGNLSASRAELTRSIEQAPSAKARFYLDLVRKALIEDRGEVVPAPRLELEMPSDPLWTSNHRLTVKGRVEDANYVGHVRVNGRRLFLEGSRSEFAFSHDIALPEGRHTLVVEAENLAGRLTRREMVVHVDSLGPQVVLERIQERGAGVRISGVVVDDAGVAAVRIGDRRLPSDGGAEVLFSHFIEDVRATPLIQCRDRLGNATAFRIDRRALLNARVSPREVAGLHLSKLFTSGDRQPPVVDLQDWKAHQTVYMEKAVLTGSVRDPGTVTSLRVNGDPVLPRSGPMIFFAHIVELRPGPNRIRLEARDAAGNRCEHTIVIERKVPKALLLEERLRLAVFAFSHKGSISSAGFAFQDDFIHALVQRRRFQVVERQRLDLILEEQKLSRTDLIDAPAALQVGHLAAAQVVVAGSLVETRTGFEVIGRVIDSETGDILCTADVYGEDKTLPGLKRFAQALALKLHREFPLVDGRLVDRKDDIIVTDLTMEKLCAQRRILIYAEEPMHHPETGQPIGADYDVLGKARVFQADDRLAKARLQADADPGICARHKVITQ